MASVAPTETQPQLGGRDCERDYKLLTRMDIDLVEVAQQTQLTYGLPNFRLGCKHATLAVVEWIACV